MSPLEALHERYLVLGERSAFYRYFSDPDIRERVHLDGPLLRTDIWLTQSGQYLYFTTDEDGGVAGALSEGDINAVCKSPGVFGAPLPWTIARRSVGGQDGTSHDPSAVSRYLRGSGRWRYPPPCSFGDARFV